MSEILGHDVNGRPLRAGDRAEIAEGAARGHGRIGRLIGPCPDFAGQMEAQMEDGPLGSARAEHWRRIDDSVDRKRPLEARPTQWRGPEDGLPPVGTVCEARHHGGWAECEIIAHVRAPENCIEAVYQAADDWDWLSSPSNFRPLKSDKERAVEAALSAAGYSIDGPCNDEVRSIVKALRRAYSAGLLRLPEEQS